MNKKKGRYKPSYGSFARSGHKDIFTKYRQAMRHLKHMDAREEMRERAVRRGIIVHVYWTKYMKSVQPWKIPGMEDLPQEMRLQKIEDEAFYRYERDPYFNAEIQQMMCNINMYVEQVR